MDDVRTARIKARIDTLLAARKKCVECIEEFSDSPRRDTWLRKLGEYNQSLANFQKYGQETVPSGVPVGVKIDVPTDDFSMVGHEPGS